MRIPCSNLCSVGYWNGFSNVSFYIQMGYFLNFTKIGIRGWEVDGDAETLVSREQEIVVSGDSCEVFCTPKTKFA